MRDRASARDQYSSIFSLHRPDSVVRKRKQPSSEAGGALAQLGKRDPPTGRGELNFGTSQKNVRAILKIGTARRRTATSRHEAAMAAFPKRSYPESTPASAETARSRCDIVP